MIGLLFFGVIIGYIFLAKFIINKVYEHYKTEKAKNIALAIMILIPTWDIILGYPIYKVLCWTNAGVHVYKTVDNVEGFYVGKQDKKFKPYIPYNGYKFIDYKEVKYNNPTGKYYRSYWIDSNTSTECFKPKFPDYADDKYTKAFKSGKCIAEKEISESKLSQWKYIEKSKTITKLFFINIRLDSTISIKDRNNRNVLSEVVSVVWKGGWLYGFLSSIPVGDNWKVRYPRIIDIKFNEFIQKTLKIKKEGK